MQYVSARYQGDSHPPYPIPTFVKRDFSLPSASLLAEYAPLTPHLTNTCHVSEMRSRYEDMNRNTAKVALKVAVHRLQKLKARVTIQDPTAAPIENLHPSTHDCLIALIITVLNRHLDTQIHQVTNAASVRTLCMSFLTESLGFEYSTGAFLA